MKDGDVFRWYYKNDDENRGVANRPFIGLAMCHH